MKLINSKTIYKKIIHSVRTLVQDIKKDIYSRIVSLITAALLVLVGVFIYAFYIHIRYGIDLGKSFIQQDIYKQVLDQKPANFSLKSVISADMYGDGTKTYFAVLVPNNRLDSLDSTEPDQIWIYDKKGESYSLSTKIAPTFSPEKNQYPDTHLEFISIVPIHKTTYSSKQAILTTWGVTGADFWGVYPLIISRNEGKYGFISSFPSEFKDINLLDSQYMKLSLSVYDAFDSARSIDTLGILDYFAKGDSLFAVFRDSQSCHACNYKTRIDIYRPDYQNIVYDDRITNLYYLPVEKDPLKFINALTDTKYESFQSYVNQLIKKYK